PYIVDALKEEGDSVLSSDDTKLKQIANMVKTRIEIWPDIADMVKFFAKLPEYDTAIYSHKKMKTNEETSLKVLKEVLPLLEAHDDYTNDALYALLSDYIKTNEYKNGYVLWPVRIAVSGKEMTPCGATELMEVIGKEETINRIKKGIELLEK
ncbi:MAG: glutamate--tRNA ligase, partial [Butyrivibrio sp.]|nr:glutamate--tRNA ligase [Butyrivibrio sp.]